MKMSEKSDLIKKILDEKFPYLQMSRPLCRAGEPYWIFISFFDVEYLRMNFISIDTHEKEISEDSIRDEILAALYKVKQKIESDIQKIEDKIDIEEAKKALEKGKFIPLEDLEND
jgi:hypothetical protein